MRFDLNQARSCARAVPDNTQLQVEIQVGPLLDAQRDARRAGGVRWDESFAEALPTLPTDLAQCPASSSTSTTSTRRPRADARLGYIR